MTPLTRDLADLLAQHRGEVTTNTPPDVLAAHMVAALALFERSLLDRARHPFYAPGRERLNDG
jgi:hypothetical protein